MDKKLNNKKVNKNLLQVATILHDGDYHNGRCIGEQLGITRSAVWKNIKKLASYGFKIHSVKGKGYALLEPLILLNYNKIKENIKSTVDLHVLQNIDSTNNYLKKLKHDHLIKVCIAEQQKAGKGRFNRTWFSPFGRNIYLSCLYPFQKDVSELSGLSLVASLSLIHVLQQDKNFNSLRVKWPNDIFYLNKKISGILVEIQAETNGFCHAIIGVGINANMLEDEGVIKQPWTSLQKISNQYIDRNILCANLINHLIDYLQIFEKEGLSPFIKEWREYDYLMDKKIAIKNINENIQGKMVGINHQGHLLLELCDQKVKAFSSGEASILSA